MLYAKVLALAKTIKRTDQIDEMWTKLFTTEHTCFISTGLENDKLEEDVVNVSRLLREMQDMVC